MCFPMSGLIQHIKSWDEKLVEPHSYRFPLLCPPWQLLMLRSAVTAEQKSPFSGFLECQLFFSE